MPGRSRGIARVSPFSVQDFVDRQRRVRERAQREGFDALLLADPANLYYLTGYDAWSFYVPQALFLPVEGMPTLFLREMDANGAWRTAIGIPADHIVGYPEGYIHRDEVDPGLWMARMLRERGYGGVGRVGYEGDAHFFTIRTHRAFAETLPEWDFVDCKALVNWERLVKSPTEIELMRSAGIVCAAAMRAGMNALAPGRPQNEVAAEVLAAQALGVGGVDGDYPAIIPMFPTGVSAGTPHLTWTGSPLPTGLPITIELAGAHHRYHAALARTAVIGKPSKELEQLADVTVGALTAAIEAVKPGVTADHVAAQFRRVIEAAGYAKRSRLGYSIGIGYPPDWGERTVSIRSEDQTVLAENMTFHLIAGMWMSAFGFETSESVRVTADGVEVLTDSPPTLISIDSRRVL